MAKKKSTKTLDVIERIAMKITRGVGSTYSILIHTALFMLAFVMYFWGISINRILLVVTTLVSLEAIYLSIFIQMSVNKQDSQLREVARDVEEIQEDVEEIQEDVDEIQRDVDEIQEDVEEIQEDEEEYEADEIKEQKMMENIEKTLLILAKEIQDLKKNHK